jgi:hypothetical protein
VFQGARTGVVRQIQTNWSPKLQGIHCIVSHLHYTTTSDFFLFLKIILKKYLYCNCKLIYVGIG